MSIAVSCGGCGKKLSAPDVAAGKKVKCPKCGVASPVPATAKPAPAVAKVCSDCGIDVSGQPRTKDTAGRYYCQPCWTARAAAKRMQAAPVKSAPIVSKPALEESLANPFEDSYGNSQSASATACPVCGRDVLPDDMTTDEMGEPICWPCLNERNSPLELAASEPAVETTAPAPSAPGVAWAPPARKPTVEASSGGETSLFKKLGILALGLAFLGYFGIWPMIQVTQHVPKISFSFKGILLGAMLTPLAVISLIFGDDVYRFKKRRESLTGKEIVIVVCALLTGVGMTVFVYYFFDSHGYAVKW